MLDCWFLSYSIYANLSLIRGKIFPMERYYKTSELKSQNEKESYVQSLK